MFIESLKRFIKVLIGPYNGWMAEGAANEATEEMIITLPPPFDNIQVQKNLNRKYKILQLNLNNMVFQIQLEI